MQFFGINLSIAEDPKMSLFFNVRKGHDYHRLTFFVSLTHFLVLQLTKGFLYVVKPEDNFEIRNSVNRLNTVAGDAVSVSHLKCITLKPSSCFISI